MSLTKNLFGGIGFFSYIARSTISIGSLILKLVFNLRLFLFASTLVIILGVLLKGTELKTILIIVGSVIVIGFGILVFCIWNIASKFSKKNLISPELSDSYFKSRGKIYYSPMGNWFNLGYNKCDVNIETFEVLTRNVAKDKNSIFSGYKKQDHIDYGSFKVISEKLCKDKNNAYWMDFFSLQLFKVEIEGIDVETFEYIDGKRGQNRHWAKDKNHYYFKGEKLNVDYGSFEFLSNHFFCDRENLYTDLDASEIQLIKKFDAFPEALNEEYIFCDDVIFYIQMTGIHKVELITIDFKEPITALRFITKDVMSINEEVINYGVLLPDAHSDSYELVRDEEHGTESWHKYYKDKYHVYYNSAIIEMADPATFAFVKHAYSKDKNHVYCENEILDGADTKSFRIDKKTWDAVDDLGNRYNSVGEKL